MGLPHHLRVDAHRTPLFPRLRLFLAPSPPESIEYWTRRQTHEETRHQTIFPSVFPDQDPP